MSRGFVEFGQLVRAFRRQEGLTQQELGIEIGCSRTAVALLEQGRRLPGLDVLRSMEARLRMPADVVSPFRSSALQTLGSRMHSARTTFVPFQQVSVSGISGSGKSTLTRLLARSFRAEIVGSQPRGRLYLQDLADDAGRWAFETQVAFLAGKAQAIRSAIEEGRPTILERTLSEDVEIYARMFVEGGAMDERTAGTFREAADAIGRDLPQPEYIVVCMCSPETALARTKARGRVDTKLHTIDFLKKSAALYDEWVAELSGPESYVLDTDRSDLSRPGVLEQVFNEIQWVMRNHLADPQLLLFGEGEAPAASLEHLRPIHRHRWKPVPKSFRSRLGETTPVLAPVAYVAAPFTGLDSEDQPVDGDQATLFRTVQPHGRIPRAGFRQVLLGIERGLRHHGLSTVVPHRDVNEWGRKTLSPSEAMAVCSEQVRGADILVAVLGTSCGAHYEFGLASGLGKPCVLLLPRDFQTSFLALGTNALASPDTLTLEYSHLHDVPQQLIESTELASFLERHFGVEKGVR